MRASPPLLVTLTGFAVWRSAVLALSILAVLAVAAWLATAEQASGVVPRALGGIGLAAVAAAFAWLWSAPASPVDLRWDGMQWHLSAAHGDGRASTPGRLSVAMDLGAWMLLRFVAGGPEVRNAVRWLPAEARSLPSGWHALRCAVHAPQPGPRASRAAERPTP